MQKVTVRWKLQDCKTAREFGSVKCPLNANDNMHDDYVYYEFWHVDAAGHIVYETWGAMDAVGNVILGNNRDEFTRDGGDCTRSIEQYRQSGEVIFVPRGTAGFDPVTYKRGGGGPWSRIAPSKCEEPAFPFGKPIALKRTLKMEWFCCNACCKNRQKLESPVGADYTVLYGVTASPSFTNDIPLPSGFQE